MEEEYRNYIDIIENNKRIVFKTLFLEITNQCNYRCKHCYNCSGEFGIKEISLGELKKILLDFVVHGIDSVVLSGGEALLHTKVWEFLELIQWYGLQITLLTNGKLLNETNINNLKKYNVYIQISLDGGTEKTNDFIRQSGSFADVISALDILKKQNYLENVSINTVLCHQNQGEIGDIVNICDKYPVSVLGFSLLNNMGQAPKNNLAIKDNELLEAIKIINNIDDTIHTNVKQIDVTKKCRFSTLEKEIFLTPVVDVYGNLYACEFLRDPMFSIGNVFEERLDDILVNDAIKRILLLINIRRHFISKCHQCGISSSCLSGCIVQNINNNYFEPQYCSYMKKSFLHDLGAEKNDY